MFGLPLPYAALGALLLALGAYFTGHHYGWAERDGEMQIEIAKKNDEARSKERAMGEQLNTNATQLLEANNALDQKSSDLQRAIRAGRVRIPTASCVQASPGAAPAPANSAEASSESDRQTLLLIAQIAADGDRAINQLNSCIDAYNAVREQVNADNR